MKTFGRKTIYANYTESELLSGKQPERDAKVLDIIVNSISQHDKNNEESIYLQNYLYGDQDVKEKKKLTRTDINHTGVENWAFAFQDWKKAFLLGKPIQYAPLDDKANNEITELNKYNVFENKDQKDQDLYEDIFTCGRAFRFNKPSKITEDDETPYNIVNLDVENVEVVYSSSIDHEQLLSYIKTSKVFIDQQVDPKTGKPANIPRNYDEYTVYTRDMQYIINNLSGNYKIVRRKILALKIHLINEYYFNKKRISLLEIVKDILNDINTVENLDLDDIESFVNSIMVFTNAEVNKEGMEKIKEFGAVSIKSTDQKKASVELLQSRLKSLDTQIYYLRKLTALHSILSVPMQSNNGDLTNAETGKGMLVGQGFTSASVRVENEEKSFKKCDRDSLKVILKICKEAAGSKIKKLKVSDIDIKFSRDLSDNLLTKTTALLNLTTAQIPPEIRNAIVGLFSDPVAVTKLQESFIEEQRKIQEEIKKRDNNENNINQNMNKVENSQELDSQGQ